MKAVGGLLSLLACGFGAEDEEADVAEGADDACVGDGEHGGGVDDDLVIDFGQFVEGVDESL